MASCCGPTEGPCEIMLLVYTARTVSIDLTRVNDKEHYANYFQLHATANTDSWSPETGPQSGTHTSASLCPVRGQVRERALFTHWSLVVNLDYSRGRLASRE